MRCILGEGGGRVPNVWNLCFILLIACFKSSWIWLFLHPGSPFSAGCCVLVTRPLFFLERGDPYFLSFKMFHTYLVPALFLSGALASFSAMVLKTRYGYLVCALPPGAFARWSEIGNSCMCVCMYIRMLLHAHRCTPTHLYVSLYRLFFFPIVMKFTPVLPIPVCPHRVPFCLPLHVCVFLLSQWELTLALSNISPFTYLFSFVFLLMY